MKEPDSQPEGQNTEKPLNFNDPLNEGLVLGDIVRFAFDCGKISLSEYLRFQTFGLNEDLKSKLKG